jgi:hypothetical protein
MRNRIFFVIIFFFVSCNTYRNKIIGYWVIDNIKTKSNKNIKLYFNLINFNTDGTCNLPMIDPTNSVRNATWELINKNDKYNVAIASEKPNSNTYFFCGVYTVLCYLDSTTKQKKIVLTSDSLIMDCSQFLK